MRNLLTIYRREMAAYFNSPIAYIVMCLFLLILGFIFFGFFRFFSSPEPDIGLYFQILPFVLGLFVPAVTMRLWADDKRTGSIEILMTLPLRSWEIVLGKYFAALTVILVILGLSVVVPLSCSFVATVDWGVVISSYLGAIIISCVYVAIGTWSSTLTQSQIIALLVATAICYAAYLLSFPQVSQFFDGVLFGTGRFLTWFGTYPHYQDFAKGLVHPVGFIYGAGMTAFFLIANNVFVEGRKF